MVSWCVGHLVELAQPEVYDAKYSKWAYACLLYTSESTQIVTMHIQSVDQTAAIKTIKRIITELDRSKIEEQKKAVRSGYDIDVYKRQAMDYAQAAPSLSQAQRIKKLAQEGECTLDAMCEIMNEIKKGELDRVTFKTDSLRKYFPKSYTNKQMEDKIIQLLEQWQKKREKTMER